MRKLKITILLYILCIANLATANIDKDKNQEPKNELSFAFGSAYNIPLPIKIKQAEEQDIKFTAKYSTKPFSSPPYYHIRYSRWNDDKAWEIELIHHKLYLKNNPKDVQAFTITNGYNLIFINRAYRTKLTENIPFIWRIGAGPVVTHPESIVRGKKFDEKGGLRWIDTDGYFVSGLAAQGAVELDYTLYKNLKAYAEGKISGSFATVPIHSGRADVYNISTHFLAGVKYAF